GAARLPGMVAALTPLPVLGVPIESRALKGMDSLLSIVQMPAGIPVATFAIGRAGAVNAALFAAAILGLSDAAAGQALDDWRRTQTQGVAERPDRRCCRRPYWPRVRPSAFWAAASSVGCPHSPRRGSAFAATCARAMPPARRRRTAARRQS